MSTAYAYTCRMREDLTSEVQVMRDMCHVWAKDKLRMLTFAGLTCDGYPSLDTQVWKREAGKVIHDRLHVGDAVLFFGIGRCFLSPADLFETCRGLYVHGQRCVLVDLGLEWGTPASMGAIAIAERIAAMPIRDEKKKKRN